MNLRRSSIGLLLFLLAILSRTTAPFAMTQIGFDPIAGAAICSHDGAAQNSPPGSGVPLAEHDHCAFACCQAFVTASNEAAVPAPFVIAFFVKLTPASGKAASLAPALAYAARAPPAIS